MTRGLSGEGDEDAEADVRRVLEKWRMLDEEEAEEAEREVKRVVSCAISIKLQVPWIIF